MPCYRPLVAYRLSDGSVSFKGKKDQGRGDTLSLPCGHCAGCRLERSREWAVRCMHEASLYASNAYVTLTYNSDNLPAGGSLRYVDFQDFMRRLRYEKGPVRFYMCGEYGEENWRPHFHACLFGVEFSDRVFFRNAPSGEKLYRSSVLERLWPFGYSSIGEVTFESAAYVARYIMKKVTGDAAITHYAVVDPVTGECVSRVPEFNRMSLKPGIGARWLDKYETDVYPSGRVVVRGVESMAPRYYDKRYKERQAEKFDVVAFNRERAARLRYLDNTDERLVVKEKVRLAAIKMLKRNI